MGSRKEELSAAHDTITQLQVKLEEAKGEPLKFNEKEREAQEKKTKDAEKKADEAKRAAKLKKKEKLSDILMAHGAEFLAMKAAKDNADAGDKKQKDEVTKAAKSGARAAAVAAVKKSRAEAKKDKRNDKAKIREITTAAAQVAVKKLLAEQEELVEKTVKTVTAKAIKKYPPALSLADEDDDTPNEFVAPPSIHLSLDGLGAAPDQVAELEKDSAKNADVENADAKKADAKAAAQAKQDA